MQSTTTSPGQKGSEPLIKLRPCRCRAQELPQQLQGSQTARSEFWGKPAGAAKQVHLQGKVANKLLLWPAGLQQVVRTSICVPLRASNRNARMSWPWLA